MGRKNRHTHQHRHKHTPPSGAAGPAWMRVEDGPQIMTSPHSVRAYGIALAAVGGVVLLRTSLPDPWRAFHMPFAALLAAVGVAAWLAGRGPAIVAGLLGFAACEWLDHGVDDELDATGALVRFSIFAACCAPIIALG